MTPITADTVAANDQTTVRDRVVDAARRAAHVSHEARLLKSLATDAVEDGVHAARRAMTSVKRRIERLEDLKDDAVHRVKRQPVKTVAIAAAAGLLFGAAIGWVGGRLQSRTRTDNW